MSVEFRSSSWLPEDGALRLQLVSTQHHRCVMATWMELTDQDDVQLLFVRGVGGEHEIVWTTAKLLGG